QRGGEQWAAQWAGIGHLAAAGAGYVVGGPGAGVLAPFAPFSVQPAAASGTSGMRRAGMAGTTSGPTPRESAIRGVRGTWAGRAVSTRRWTYHYQPGLKRYRCKEKDCKRTFNDLTGTLLDGSKRSVIHWILATFLLCLSCSSRRMAKEL